MANKTIEYNLTDAFAEQLANVKLKQIVTDSEGQVKTRELALEACNKVRKGRVAAQTFLCLEEDAWPEVYLQGKADQPNSSHLVMTVEGCYSSGVCTDSMRELFANNFFTLVQINQGLDRDTSEMLLNSY